MKLMKHVGIQHFIDNVTDCIFAHEKAAFENCVMKKLFTDLFLSFLK